MLSYFSETGAQAAVWDSAVKQADLASTVAMANPNKQLMV